MFIWSPNNFPPSLVFSLPIPFVRALAVSTFSRLILRSLPPQKPSDLWIEASVLVILYPSTDHIFPAFAFDSWTELGFWAPIRPPETVSRALPRVRLCLSVFLLCDPIWIYDWWGGSWEPIGTAAGADLQAAEALLAVFLVETTFFLSWWVPQVRQPERVQWRDGRCPSLTNSCEFLVEFW